MARLAAATAAAAMLAVLPGAPASAAGKGVCAKSVDAAVEKLAVAEPTAMTSYYCESGEIFITGYGVGLAPGTQVTITRSSWSGTDSDGRRLDEVSDTTTVTVSAVGNASATYNRDDPSWGYWSVSAQTVIRGADGSVLATSPVITPVCFCCW